MFKLLIFYSLVPLGINTEVFNPPETAGPHIALYTFSNDLFDDSNGEILYYSIILGIYGYHEESTASTWKGTVDTWPLISNKNVTSDITSFQATPKMWNPFQNSMDNRLAMLNIKFSINFR